MKSGRKGPTFKNIEKITINVPSLKNGTEIIKKWIYILTLQWHCHIKLLIEYPIWIYILLGILSLLVLTLIYFFYYGMLNLYKWVELKIFSPKGWRIKR